MRMLSSSLSKIKRVKFEYLEQLHVFCLNFGSAAGNCLRSEET